MVAVRQGMSFAEIDDLREAVDWAIELLLEPPATEGASIECVLRTGGGFLEVEAGRTDEAGAAASARFKKAADASNITATVDSDRGRLLVRKPVGNPGNPGNLGSPSA